MPLTFEFTLTHDAASWLHTGTTDGVDNSTQWHISDAYMYFDVISLDAEVANNYNILLRQGQSLNVSYHSSLCQSQAVLGNSFSLQIIRNLARVKSLFITFSHEKEADSKPDSTQFWHPNLEDQDSPIEFNSSIGGKRLIINPIGPKAVSYTHLTLPTTPYV